MLFGSFPGRCLLLLFAILLERDQIGEIVAVAFFLHALAYVDRLVFGQDAHERTQLHPPLLLGHAMSFILLLLLLQELFKEKEWHSYHMTTKMDDSNDEVFLTRSRWSP